MRMRSFITSLAVVTCVAAAGNAQSNSSAQQVKETVRADTSSVSDSTSKPDTYRFPVLNLTARITLVPTHRDAPAPAPVPRRMRNGAALMIVGGVAMLVGSAIDGDEGHLIVVGGAVVGLIGLYQYLK